MRSLFALITILSLMTSCSSYKRSTHKAEKLTTEYAEQNTLPYELTLTKFVGKYEKGEATTAGAEKPLSKSKKKKKKLRSLDVSFEIHNFPGLTEARQLFVNTLEGLKTKLNNELSPKELTESPLTVGNITMQMEFSHFFGNYFDTVAVKSIRLADGIITYYAERNLIVKQESYQEAESLANAQPHVKYWEPEDNITLE